MEVFEAADCCFTRSQVQATIERLAQVITQDYQDKNPLLLCVMNGGLIFTGELLLKLSFPLQYDYIHATRYAGQTRGGELNWIAESGISLQDRHVLIVDDINDEGITLTAIVEHCKSQNPLSVKTVVLVDKQHERKKIKADYQGLSVEDRYVFGYGMDYKDYWRNAPGIFAVKDS
jgi:hypoxanthine phosphoribosyltransferase